jgi:hypothetical protein
MCKSCTGANMVYVVYSRAGHVFILKHDFISKSFAAVHEAFSNVYPDDKVPNKTSTSNKLQADACDREGGEHF